MYPKQRDVIMKQNPVQFQKGLSLALFPENYRTEDKCDSCENSTPLSGRIQSPVQSVIQTGSDASAPWIRRGSDAADAVSPLKTI